MGTKIETESSPKVISILSGKTLRERIVKFFENAYYSIGSKLKCIRCTSEEQAEYLTREFHQAGYCWCSSQPYLKSNWQHDYDEIFYFDERTYSSSRYWEQDGSIPPLIIEFEDFVGNNYEEQIKLETSKFIDFINNAAPIVN